MENKYDLSDQISWVNTWWSFKYHLQNLKLKVHRANCLLSKIRYYVKFPLLQTIYYALFDSHLRYGRQIWGQRQNESIESIEKTQNKAIRILNFKGPREGAENLYIQRIKNR